jgi:prepilin-type N-terminal cleavage/methylation domain-containing protein
MNQRGFTITELLVVVAIIGILAAIAVPQYGAYRQRGFDARAQSDLRNAALAQEAAYAASQAYVSCNETDCAQKLPGFLASPGVKLAMTGSGDTFSGTASHAQGSRPWTYDSTKGGLQP